MSVRDRIVEEMNARTLSDTLLRVLLRAQVLQYQAPLIEEAERRRCTICLQPIVNGWCRCTL